MLTFVVRRVFIALPVLLGITVLLFSFIALAPGDAVDAYIPHGVPVSPEVREAMARQLGLDQPLPVRYVRWLTLTAQGNLGTAAITGRPVNDVVGSAFLASVALVGPALLMGIVVGIPLGILAAVRLSTVTDLTLTGVAFFGISIPPFLLALGGLYVLGLQLRLVPMGGMTTPAQPFELADFLAHLALPALVLGIAYMAIFMRYTRAAMLEVLGSPYLTTAVAKGLVGRTVILRHAFRNALVPIITVIGLSVPEVVGGALVVENVFTWPGMGSLLVSAVTGRDFQVIMGVSLVIAVAVVVTNIATDVAYAFADPRIRY